MRSSRIPPSHRHLPHLVAAQAHALGNRHQPTVALASHLESHRTQLLNAKSISRIKPALQVWHHRMRHRGLHQHHQRSCRLLLLIILFLLLLLLHLLLLSYLRVVFRDQHQEISPTEEDHGSIQHLLPS